MLDSIKIKVICYNDYDVITITILHFTLKFETSFESYISKVLLMYALKHTFVNHFRKLL